MEGLDLSKIEVLFVSRTWMKAGKSWRCFMELPDISNLPEALTALIESQVKIEIKGPVSAVIEPAFIVDVPSKGKKFQIVIETVYEHQKSVGPRLTALTGEKAVLSIVPLEPVAKPDMPSSNIHKEKRISEKALRGLHTNFFGNKKFQAFIGKEIGEEIADNVTCKTAFRILFRVDSCKDILQEDFDRFLKNFNSWLNDKEGVA